MQASIEMRVPLINKELVVKNIKTVNGRITSIMPNETKNL